MFRKLKEREKKTKTDPSRSSEADLIADGETVDKAAFFPRWRTFCPPRGRQLPWQK